ncbi:imelysin family protein [Stigmatella sp. ncwal1]|uniref:Imelysin family protein n=1 Tax=Stigmatella ashevillensis TaxID=2995309 RepID=A0ABT5DQL8_9BACT|nr:imelysin family protein [Stigmatella ashevillena]MDC0715023.1 imelysin family protein [Stigmatella ashevillena]
MTLSRFWLRPLALTGALVLMSCSDDEGGGPAESTFDKQIVVHFADDVVVPTYQQLAARLEALDTAANALAAAPTAERLTAARDAWFAARVPWEQSEGFLFGPVDSFGYDPAMDSWPVNRSDLDAVLAGSAAFTPEYVGNLEETLKGFHTVEYLLFARDPSTGAQKTVQNFTPREFEYLKAISLQLKNIGAALSNSWTQTVDGRPPYRNAFAGAGESGNTFYPSLQNAAEEMVGGIVNILDEVANGKIADPYDAKDPELVESQFAYNSLTDFTNNIRSVQNAYLGHLQNAPAKGPSLADFVKDANPELDIRIRKELTDAIAALALIPEPFRESIKDPNAADEIEAAQEAIRKAQNTFQSNVAPLLGQ